MWSDSYCILGLKLSHIPVLWRLQRKDFGVGEEKQLSECLELYQFTKCVSLLRKWYSSSHAVLRDYFNRHFYGQNQQPGLPVSLSPTVLYEVQSCKVYLTVWSQSNLLVWDLNAAPCSPSSPPEQEGCALKQELEPFARQGSKPNSTWRIAVAGFAYFVIAMHWGYWGNCLRMLEHLRMAQHLYFNNPIGAHAANYHPNAFPSFWVESLPKKRLSW